MTLGGFLYALLVVAAAYVLGRLHEEKYINEKLVRTREVDLSALLDDEGGSVHAHMERTYVGSGSISRVLRKRRLPVGPASRSPDR